MIRATYAILAAILLVAACVPATQMSALPTATQAPASTQGPLPHVDWLAYHDATAGFSIQFPLTWKRQNPTGYPVVYTLTAAPGTTLLEKRLEINVTPDATGCKEATYEGAASTPQDVTVAGIQFTKETGQGIAAGNIYDWTAYSTVKSSTCITITFVLHSASAGVYGTEPAPFNRATEAQIFDEILSTFRFDP